MLKFFLTSVLILGVFLLGVYISLFMLPIRQLVELRLTPEFEKNLKLPECSKIGFFYDKNKRIQMVSEYLLPKTVNPDEVIWLKRNNGFKCQ
jgi:hypothetical protein